MCGYFDALIAEFHRVRAVTRIGLVLTPPSSRSQDGIRNYNRSGNRQTRWQVRRNMHRACERMIERYASDASRRISLSHRTSTSMHSAATRRSPRRRTRGRPKISPASTQPVHPNADGYRQIGDSIYAWLKAVAPPHTAKGD